MPRSRMPLPANNDPVAEARRRAEQALLKIARLIGRQMAREDFAKRPPQAVNNCSEEP